MSLHRASLFAITALFTAGMTSIASAGCCDWGASAPFAYAPTGCGGGCGTPTAAIIYAQPVAPAPAPVIVSTWATGWGTGCGCQRAVAYAAPVLAPTPIAPAPIYVVNQGPEYAGPGLMVPYRTYSPAAAYAASSAYPYVPGYGYGYGTPAYYPHHVYGRPAPRIAYRERVFAHPRYYAQHYYGPMPRWRPYPHRPLGVRG